MNGKIDKQGYLEIERKGKYKSASCPYTLQKYDKGVKGISCGDWCALFREPTKAENITFIDLCHGMIFFEEFKDER